MTYAAHRTVLRPALLEREHSTGHAGPASDTPSYTYWLRINNHRLTLYHEIHSCLVLHATKRQPLHVVPSVHLQGRREGAQRPHTVERFCRQQ
jgi:hypothetical protein